MECSCDVSGALGFDDGYVLLISETDPVADVLMTCDECNEVIKQGETYHREEYEWENTTTVHNTCTGCMSARNTMFKGGFVFGQIWQDISEFVVEGDGDIPESCIASLEPRAREMLLGIIDDYYRNIDEN